MALVNYEASDDSSEEDSTAEDLPSVTTRTESVVAKPETSTEVSTNKLLFSRLPEPNNRSAPQNSSLNDITVKKSGSGPIKIFVPSLKHYAEEEDEEMDEKKAKRFKGSQSGTGLRSLLPKPKNSSAKPMTTSSFIPQSLVRPKAKPSTSRASQSVAKAEEAEDNVNYFFSQEEEKSDISTASEVVLSDVAFGPLPDITPMISEPLPLQSSSSYSLNDITYKKLIASKFGEEAPEDINIVDIDVSKHLSESKDWLKTISEEKDQSFNELEFSSTARRKHQITFLATQAKAREVELKNEWARNRQTKTMSRSKYGF